MAVKVMHVLPQLAVGGAETQVVRLAQAVDPARIHSCIYACRPGGSLELPALSQEVTIEVDPGGLGALGRFWRLYRSIREWQPDIVHIHLSLTGYLAARAAGSRRMVVHYHGIYPSTHHRNAWRVRLWKLMDAYCRGDLALACSRAVRDQRIRIHGIAPSRVRVLYNGLDLAEFDGLAGSRGPGEGIPAESNETVLCFVGRLVPQKGLDLLFRGLGLLEQVPPWKVLLVGQGVEEPRLRAMAADLGLRDRVLFVGPKAWREIPAILTGCDLFVHPSRREGLGLSIVEAMAARLPVVATSVGGIPEVVTHGKTGMLVPPENPAALADAISHMIQHPDERRRMGRNGREFVEENFDINKIARQLEEIYEELVSDD